MDWLNWYDLITPTNPVAAIFFGVLFSIIAGIWIWFETRERNASLLALIAGVGASLIVVALLYLFGFYSS